VWVYPIERKNIMGDLEDSVQRHPAGNARKETIWDTAWAISKAMQVGREEERNRILAIIKDNILPIGDIDKVIALIKGENK
jgi:hypothetical protein